MNYKDITHVLPPNFEEIEKWPYRPLILKLGQHITDRKKRKVTVKDPEYYGLYEMVTDEMAAVALKMKVRVHYTTEEMLRRTKQKDEKELVELLNKMAYNGLIEKTHEGKNGELTWTLPKFVMGSAEYMNMRWDDLQKHNQVATFFERMTYDPLEGITQMIPPGGAGIGMKVIPVEKAIPANNTSVSLEHISHWLDKYKGKYAACPCSCRMCERTLGQGAPDDYEDWCIALGDIADYMVEMKKGHYIDRAEVDRILKKAEDYGYVHQITNMDGEDKIIAICNCNVQICHALRLSQLFNTPNCSRSAFTARVNPDNCVGCGRCVEFCPAGAVKLGQRLCTKNGFIEYPKMELPDNVRWGKDKWDPNYTNNNRINTYPTGTAPCKAACPAHIAVEGYLKLANEGRYEEALALIKRENPFPAICGRICNKRCEAACTRARIDKSVAIDAVKKFVAERDLKKETRFIPPLETGFADDSKRWPQKIAIIGAGPAGLSCAYYLAVNGFKPTVFEKNERPGGMMTYGIPTYKLDHKIIESEIDVLRELGVTFKCGVEVGKDITINDLRQEGYTGFYIAIGCQEGRLPGIPGEDAKDAETAISFLKKASDDHNQKIDRPVIVIGGGNVAIDAARTAHRFHAPKVTMVSLEERNAMPASQEEIEEALSEQIEILNGWGPKEVKTGEDGKIQSVVFKRCLRTIDPETKRFSPLYKEDEILEIPANRVIFAIGQKTYWGNLLDGTGVVLEKGRVLIDPKSYQTKDPQIFIGGDVLTGPKFVIDAIAAGKEAAISLKREVIPGTQIVDGRDARVFTSLNKDDLVFGDYDHSPRQEEGYAKVNGLDMSFEDARNVLSEEQVKVETARCLRCGASIVDENKCIGCGVCTTKCEFDAIHLSRTHPENGKMVACEDMVKELLPYVVKRAIKIKKHDHELKKEAKKKKKENIHA